MKNKKITHDLPYILSAQRKISCDCPPYPPEKKLNFADSRPLPRSVYTRFLKATIPSLLEYPTLKFSKFSKN